MAENVPLDHPTLLVSGQEQEMQPQMISQDQIEQISKNLREQISKSVKDMKVLSYEATSESQHEQLLLPLSPMSQEINNALLDEVTPKKRGKKPTTKVVGEFSLSYELPPICIQNNIDDLDNFFLRDECASDPNKCHQFSFIERLQNWTLRLRQRTKGTHCDVYFNHMMSGITFRSKKEVVNFMIYEKYPSKRIKKEAKKAKKAKKCKKLEVVEASAVTNNESLSEEKQKCDEEIDQMALDRERVVKFLAESYGNLMNYDFGQNK